MTCSRNRVTGFTLVEAIMVITITGILGAVVATFIRPVFDSYFDSVRRAALVDEADVAMRRIARDVRLALPNSLRVATAGGRNYIEFIMTSDGGRYRDSSDGSSDSTPTTPSDCDGTPTPDDGPCYLDFSTAANRSFDVMGLMPGMGVGPSGDFVVVNNLGPGYDPANAYNFNAATSTCTDPLVGCNIARIQAVNGNTLTMTSNTFATQSPATPSRSSRFQVVPNAQQAVTYSCPTAAGVMTRQWAYGFNAAQGTPPAGGTSANLLGGAACGQNPCVSCVVDYTPNVLQRNGLLFIQLTVSDSTGEAVTMFQQIHVDNSP